MWQLNGQIYLRTQVGVLVGFRANPLKQAEQIGLLFESSAHVLQPVLQAIYDKYCQDLKYNYAENLLQEIIIMQLVNYFLFRQVFISINLCCYIYIMITRCVVSELKFFHIVEYV